jgi:hypothetical protein
VASGIAPLDPLDFRLGTGRSSSSVAGPTPAAEGGPADGGPAKGTGLIPGRVADEAHTGGVGRSPGARGGIPGIGLGGGAAGFGGPSDEEVDDGVAVVVDDEADFGSDGEDAARFGATGAGRSTSSPSSSASPPTIDRLRGGGVSSSRVDSSIPWLSAGGSWLDAAATFGTGSPPAEVGRTTIAFAQAGHLKVKPVGGIRRSSSSCRALHR